MAPEIYFNTNNYFSNLLNNQQMESPAWGSLSSVPNGSNLPLMLSQPVMTDSLSVAVDQTQLLDANLMKAWIDRINELQKVTQPEIESNMSDGDYGKIGNGGKITTLFKGNADDLNQHLKGVLAGKGQKLLELQNKYGINAAFMAAIVNCESGHGSSNAAKTKNNVAGIMGKGGMSLKSFGSVDECLEYLASLLKNNYANKGKDTIAEVQKMYCPVGAANDPTGLNKNWYTGVTNLTQKIESSASSDINLA